MNMAIKAIAPWFGGKRTLAPEIVREMGPHRMYWGVCCGSLAVEFAKEPSSMEVCIDLHGDLTNLAFVLQNESLAVELYARVARTLLSDELFKKSAQVIRTEVAPSGDTPPDIDRAYHYFVVSWFGRNGVAGTSNYNAGFCARYTANGGHAATRFTSAVESIPAWHHRLRAMMILRGNIFDHIPRIDDQPNTLIYCDPPYLVKAAKYLHDFSESDHEKLAAMLCAKKKARIIVSYYEHPRLAELYPGWTVRRFNVSKAMASQGKRDSANDIRATECLLINHESLVEPKGIFGN